MKVTVFALAAALALVWIGTASAAEIMTHKRTVEYKVVEPCDVLVAEGEVVLEWADCGGDYAVVSIDYAGYDHPLTLMFSAGNPDFSELDEHTYWAFMCSKCWKGPWDVYCMDCNPCDWYCNRQQASWCCDTINAYAYLPTCMALQIVDVY